MYIPIAVVLDDFLNRHGRGNASYTLPESTAVLRHDDLPDDATIAYASLEPESDSRDDVLREARECCTRALMLLPHEAEPDDLVGTQQVSLRDEMARLIDRIDAATITQSTRHLIVGIRSTAFPEVDRGDELPLIFDAHVFVPQRGIPTGAER